MTPWITSSWPRGQNDSYCHLVARAISLRESSTVSPRKSQQEVGGLPDIVKQWSHPHLLLYRDRGGDGCFANSQIGAHSGTSHNSNFASPVPIMMPSLSLITFPSQSPFSKLGTFASITNINSRKPVWNWSNRRYVFYFEKGTETIIKKRDIVLLVGRIWILFWFE